MGGAGGTAGGGETRKGSLTVKWGETDASDGEGTAHGVGGFGGDLEAAAAVISHPPQQVDAEGAAGIIASQQQQPGSSQLSLQPQRRWVSWTSMMTRQGQWARTRPRGHLLQWEEQEGRPAEGKPGRAL